MAKNKENEKINKKQAHQLTQHGFNDLTKELKYLKEVKRPENLIALKEARDQGDLSENADYDTARNEQATIENRIFELERILDNYVIIHDDGSDEIHAGKNVEITVNGEVYAVSLVGTVEANPTPTTVIKGYEYKLGKISTDSPVGKAILGRKVGDSITIKSEIGKELEIKINRVIVIDEVDGEYVLKN